MDPATMSILPRISEKALSNTAKKEYVFWTPIDANKDQIKAAVEKQYDVKVKSVRVVVVKGKAKSSYRKRLQPIDGMRTKRKKAYVQLSSGEITIIEGDVDAS